jgi:hypothetical protein
MILCNGCFSEERAIRAKRIQAVRTDPSAPREKGCCDVFVSPVARSTTMLWLSYERSPNFIPSRSRLDEECKTSTFTGRLRRHPFREGSACGERRTAHPFREGSAL